jgi:hypothetical protein
MAAAVIFITTNRNRFGKGNIMNKKYVILVSVAFYIFFSSSSFAEEYLLLGVVDGDTVLVYKDKISEKIDLAGIDAPEMGQDYGLEAWRFLKSQLTDEKVVIENLRTGV